MLENTFVLMYFSALALVMTFFFIVSCLMLRIPRRHTNGGFGRIYLAKKNNTVKIKAKATQQARIMFTGYKSGI